MTSTNPLYRTLLAALLAGIATSAALAAPTIVNGGFESGFSGWTRADQLGSFGTFSIQTGTASPLNGDPVPAPPQGVNAAMSDADGPGAHVLYQDFVASAATASLSFELFIGNRGDRFTNPNTLDFSIIPINMQARVDILAEGADPFSVGPADILMTLYTSAAGDPPISGYSTVSADISALLAAHAGQSLRLRFAETDNLAQLQMGVDNVQISVVPEPASFGLAALALLGLAFSRRR